MDWLIRYQIYWQIDCKYGQLRVDLFKCEIE